jgi:general secretion pathway protein M
MMEQLRLYWRDRSERERRLLAVMFALVAAVVFWFGFVVPVNNARADARARLDRAAIVSGQVAARVTALRQIASRVPPRLDGTLVTAVGAAASEAGFTPTTIDPQGDDRVAISLSSAKSQALFAWLAAMEARGIFAEKVTIRPNSDATVSSEMVLRMRRRP